MVAGKGILLLDAETRNPQEPAAIGLHARTIASDVHARTGAAVFGLLLLLSVAVGTDRAVWRVGDTNIRFELLAGVVALAAVAVYYGRRVFAAMGVVEWLLVAWLVANFVASALFAPSPSSSL